MRLLLDQGLPRGAALGLRDLGHDCMHVGEIGMSCAADEEILTEAFRQNAILVTLDADFHTILAVSAASAPSVIRLRIQGLDALSLVRLISKVLIDFQAELSLGSLLTVKGRKTTCHRLPIGGAIP